MRRRSGERSVGLSARGRYGLVIVTLLSMMACTGSINEGGPDGPTHGSTNIPYILGGNAGGFLETGVHIMSPGASHRGLTTVASAAGCRKPNGDLVDNFGDPMAPGLITEIIA